MAIYSCHARGGEADDGGLMPVIEMDLEVYCSCGAGLCNQSHQKHNKHGSITVEPCKKCIDAAEEKAHQKGHDEGYAEGKSDYEEVAA